jgi:hypothetical protein
MGAGVQALFQRACNARKLPDDAIEVVREEAEVVVGHDAAFPRNARQRRWAI